MRWQTPCSNVVSYNLSKNERMTYVSMHVHDDSTEMKESTNQPNPGVDRRQTHLHTLQPLSQCSNLISKVTLPLTQAVHIPPETKRSKQNMTTKYVILCVCVIYCFQILLLSPNCSWLMEKIKACIIFIMKLN